MDHAESVDAAKGGNDTRATEKMEAFLEGQRSHLKKFAGDNVRRQRDVKAFVGAVGKIRDDIRMNRANVTNAQLDQEDEDVVGGGEEKEDDEGVDYERLILKEIEDRRVGAASGAGTSNSSNGDEDEMADEPLVKEMRDRLGEKPAKKNKKGGKKRSAADAEEDEEEDEDEFEVVNDATTGHDTAATLTCPILATDLRESRQEQGVRSHLLQGGFRSYHETVQERGAAVGCPVPGCSNSHLRPNDMEEDVEMVMRVRRFKKREEREKNARMSQMDDLEEDE